MRHAPRFWFAAPDRPGLVARILTPISALTARVTAWRLARVPQQRVAVPVLSVRDLSVFENGRTPMVIALVQHLQARGLRAFVITCGQGVRVIGPVEVDARHHRAAETGDAALLIAAFTRVWVARDPVAAAREAAQAGAAVIILDEGARIAGLHRDLSLIVVDALRGFGNGHCLPAGPLREPLETGLAGADLLISIGPAAAQDRLARIWPCVDTLPRLRGALFPLRTGMNWANTPLLAFAGAGNPEEFFASLRDLGARLVRTQALEDHQSLTPVLMRRLDAEAERLGAQLVTTETDAVRLPPAFRHKVITLPLRLEIADQLLLDRALDALL